MRALRSSISTMSEPRQILQAYGLQVAARLPLGDDGHELGEALAQGMTNEPPDMMRVLRKFFQNLDSEDSRTRCGSSFQFQTKPVFWTIKSIFLTETFKLRNHSSPLSKVIRQEATTLAQKFSAFYQTFSEHDKVDLNQFTPTIQGVLDQVKQVQLKAEAKRKGGFTGKIKTLFHKFCDTLDSHKSLLGILPEGSEYISIFTGVLHVVIQVCPVLFYHVE